MKNTKKDILKNAGLLEEKIPTESRKETIEKIKDLMGAFEQLPFSKFSNSDLLVLLNALENGVKKAKKFKSS